jgi:hypothetical protein
MTLGTPLTLEVVCPTMGGHEDAIKSWQETASGNVTYHILGAAEGEQAGFLAKCQRGYEVATSDVIGYLHSDLLVHEQGWDQRVLKEFEWPTVAVVGFVGATTLGTDDIYKVPYDYRQLARGGVVSNLTDHEVHGSRDVGTRAVAVVDSCAVFVRRAFLERLGGWPVGKLPNTSHCTDLWICGEAARLGRQVRMVGVSCTHKSGGKGDAGSKWLEARGGDTRMHRDAHLVTYDLLREVLPLRVGRGQ